MTIDTDILLLINGHHAPWLDTLMWYISQAWTWIPLYVLMIGLMWRRMGWRQAALLSLLIVVTFGISDQVCHLLKHWIARPRPSHTPVLEGMLHIVRNYTGGYYGHPSSHAANTAVVAILFALLMKNATIRWIMALYVVLNCYSRMYLGVHYPSDILSGLVIGSLLAVAAYSMLRYIVCRPADDAARGSEPR